MLPEDVEGIPAWARILLPRHPVPEVFQFGYCLPTWDFFSWLPRNIDRDGWAARQSSLCIPAKPGYAGVELYLEFPGWSALEAQHLTVSMPGARSEGCVIQSGYFRLDLPLLPERKTWRVDLSSAEDFLLPTESRRRSLRLAEIRYVRKLRAPWKFTRCPAPARAASDDHAGRIEHVLVVAGPAGSGKSHLLEMLARGAQARWIREQGLTGLETWTYLTERNLTALNPRAMSRVLVHLDLTSFLTPGVGLASTSKDSAWPEALREAKRKTFITIEADTATLRRRARARILRTLFVNLLRFMSKPREVDVWERQKLGIFKRLAHFYSGSGDVQALYEQWFAVCRHLEISEHWKVSGTSTLSGNNFNLLEA